MILDFGIAFQSKTEDPKCKLDSKKESRTQESFREEFRTATKFFYTKFSIWRGVSLFIQESFNLRRTTVDAERLEEDALSPRLLATTLVI